MSANKTIKALREERALLYAEIRRLQVAAAGTIGVPATSLKSIKASQGKTEMAFEFDDMERIAQDLTGRQWPTHMLFGHPSEEALRTHLATLAKDRIVLALDSAKPLPQSFYPTPPHVKESVQQSMSELYRQLGLPATATVEVVATEVGGAIDSYGTEMLENLISSKGRGPVHHFQIIDRGPEWPLSPLPDDAPPPDWEAAPKGATHVIRSTHGQTWLKEGIEGEPGYKWSEHREEWYQSLMINADSLSNPGVEARSVAAPATDGFDDMPLVKSGVINFIFGQPGPDWSTAPVDATHSVPPHHPGSWRKVGVGSESCYWWSEHRNDWYESLLTSADQLTAPGIVARPPREAWSVDGKDDSWNFDSLAELLKDHLGEGVAAGSTVYRGVKHYDDPARFVPDADEVANHMYEQAQGSDAGEWADQYPDLNDEARAALEVALEPLQEWARQHCQPDFFTVEKITPYTVTAEDVAR